MTSTSSRTPPPIGYAALAVTLLSPLLPIVLPLAVYLQYRARREAAANPRYSWPRRWTNRPILFTVCVWAAFLLVGFVGIVVWAALGMDVV